MKHKAYYDVKHEVARMDIIGEIPQDIDAQHELAHQLVKGVEEALEGKDHRHLLIDVSETPSMYQLNRETRKILKEGGNRLGIERIAVVGADPITRMMIKVIVVLLRKSDSKFFKTEDEALGWLKGVQ